MWRLGTRGLGSCGGSRVAKAKRHQKLVKGNQMKTDMNKRKATQFMEAWKYRKEN
jgi:hypothetical protein